MELNNYITIERLQQTKVHFAITDNSTEVNTFPNSFPKISPVYNFAVLPLFPSWLNVSLMTPNPIQAW